MHGAPPSRLVDFQGGEHLGPEHLEENRVPRMEPGAKWEENIAVNGHSGDDFWGNIKEVETRFENDGKFIIRGAVSVQFFEDGALR